MINLFKHLLPRALAWSITKPTKYLRKFFDGLVEGLLVPARLFIDLYWFDLFPQYTRKLADWEWQFGIQKAQLTEQQRRDRLDARWGHFSINLSPRAVQDALQANGFNVYVHDWWVTDKVNLLIDGDMERTDVDYWPPNPDATTSKITTNPYWGLRSLRITAIAQVGSKFPQVIRYSVLKAGRTYSITGWARSDGTQVPQVAITGISIWAGTTSTEWQNFDLVYESLVDNTFVAFFAVTDPTGVEYVDFDKISIRDLGAEDTDPPVRRDPKAAPGGYYLPNRLFTIEPNLLALCGEAGIECGEALAVCGSYDQFNIDQVEYPVLTGTQLVTNGDFLLWTADDPDGWTVSESPPNSEVTEAVGGGACRIVSDGTLAQIQQTILTSGKTYRFEINVESVISGGITLFGVVFIKSFTATGKYVCYFYATGSTLTIVGAGVTDITFTNVTVYEDTAELWPNGYFNAWTAGHPDNFTVLETPPNSQVTQVGNACRFQSDGTLLSIDQAGLTAGVEYVLTLRITDATAGKIVIDNDGQTEAEFSTVGDHAVRFKSLGNPLSIRTTVTTDITFTDVSVKEAYPGTDELLTNWDLSAWTDDNPDGWLVNEWSPDRLVTQSGSAAQITTDGGPVSMAQSFVAKVGRYYILEVVVTAAASGALLVRNGPDTLVTLNAVKTYRVPFRAATGSISITDNDAAADVTVTSVSIKQADVQPYKTWYVGGQTWPDSAIVPASRREEFEDLVLKLGPAHLWPMFLIDYQ
jgi:hypothetical protein